MFIQFLYVQKKDNNEEFFYVIKYEKSMEDLNNKIYMSLYETNEIQNIHYPSKFYLKCGFKIDYNDNSWQELWNKFLYMKLKKLDLLSLIDEKKIEKYNSTDILHFYYHNYKQEINTILSDIIIKKI
jgi:hypothetical protein